MIPLCKNTGTNFKTLNIFFKSMKFQVFYAFKQSNSQFCHKSKLFRDFIGPRFPWSGLWVHMFVKVK